MDIIVTETNRYAHQLISSKTKIKKSVPMAKNVRQINWSKNPLYGNVVIRKTMARDCFNCLMKCFHFHDNNVPVLDEPRLAKIKCLVTHVNNKFKEVLIPDESVVIDESMIPWRGRLLFRQYLSGRSYKYSIKLYKYALVMVILLK